MTTDLARPARTIVPLLTKSLTPQDLDRHRAQIGVVVEALLVTHDKFGWDRTDPAVKKLVRIDWLDALQDYPIAEIRAACRLHTAEDPGRVPNWGHIKAIVIRERAKAAARYGANKPAEAPPRQPMTREQAAAVLAELGVKVNEFGGVVGLGERIDAIEAMANKDDV